MKNEQQVVLQQNSWSGNEKQPPELDKIIADLLTKLKKILFGSQVKKYNSSASFKFPFSFGSRFGLILLILFFLWLALGFFIVKPAEEAVILRFGRYVDIVESGPHWLPFGIESYTKVNVQQVNSFSFGGDYLTQSSSAEDKDLDQGQEEGQSSSAIDDDTDKNVVYAELNVQYRILDPKQYLFRIVDAESSLNQAAAAALSEVIGTMRLNAVLTIGRDQLTWAVKKRLQTLMNGYSSGIEVVAVNVRKIQAPEEVADAFLDVVQAGQDEQRYIQQAQAYARKVIPIAEGNRNRILAQAQAYQEKVILNAQADVSNYLALLRVYQQSPAITKDRMYLEAMQAVMSKSSKILLDTNKQTANLINLPLDKLFSPALSKEANLSNGEKNSVLQ